MNTNQFTLNAYLDEPTYNMDKHLEAELTASAEFYSNVYKDINGFRPQIVFKNCTTLETLQIINQLIEDLPESEVQ